MTHDITAIEQLLAACRHRVDGGSVAEIAASLCEHVMLGPCCNDRHETTRRAAVDRRRSAERQLAVEATAPQRAPVETFPPLGFPR